MRADTRVYPYAPAFWGDKTKTAAARIGLQPLYKQTRREEESEGSGEATFNPSKIAA
jgi:hypothetical protein